MQTIYNKSNFHKHTFCIFTEVECTAPQHQKPHLTSKSGSQYFFSDAGVLRISNHWGRAGNCKWRLAPLENTAKNRLKAGFAKWTDFYSDNDYQKLYYIDVDIITGKASYQHKDAPGYDNNKPLRTASETVRQIRKIRNTLVHSIDVSHNEKNPSS